MKRKEYELEDVGFAFVFMVLGYLVLSLLFSQVLSIIANSNNQAFGAIASSNVVIWLNAFLTELVYLLVFIIYSKFKKVDLKSASNLDKQFTAKKSVSLSFTTILLALVVFFASLNFINLISDLLSRRLSEPRGTLPISNFFEFVMTTITFAVLPAVCEELLFRGLIFNGLKNKFNVSLSVIFSALIFALIHFSIFQTVYQFLIGIVLALLVHFTGSILFSMLFHFVNNFTIVLISYITKGGQRIFEFATFGVLISYITKGGQRIFEFATFGWLEIFISILFFVLGILAAIGIFYVIKRISRNTSSDETTTNNEAVGLKSKISLSSLVSLIIALAICILLWCLNSFGG